MQLPDKSFERNVLMGIGVEGDSCRPAKKIAERRIARCVCPQDEHVDEEADQLLDFHAGAAGDRGAHNDVVLAGVTMQERLKRREQGHEQRGVLAPPERFQGLDDIARQAHLLRGARERLDGRPRAVSRQVENSYLAQLFAPVIQLLCQEVVPKASLLPDGEVRVLNWQLGQRRVIAPRERIVEGDELAVQRTH